MVAMLACATFACTNKTSSESEKESVNLTLDAAYGDWCIAEIAKILGKPDIEKEYRKRAQECRDGTQTCRKRA